MEQFEIISDSGWTVDDSTSIRRRGIVDYRRMVEFKKEPTKDELTQVCVWLAKNKCPGWTGVSCRKVGDKFMFTTTMDSSD